MHNFTAYFLKMTDVITRSINETHQRPAHFEHFGAKGSNISFSRINFWMALCWFLLAKDSLLTGKEYPKGNKNLCAYRYPARNYMEAVWRLISISEHRLGWRVRSENRMITISLLRLPTGLQAKEATAGPLSVKSTILCGICLRWSMILALSIRMHAHVKLRNS